MLNKLIELNEFIDENYVEKLSYDVLFDGVELVFHYSISLGWEPVYGAKKVFNACDIKTNLQGLDNEIKKIYEWLENSHYKEK